jgi:hypothetical protein
MNALLLLAIAAAPIHLVDAGGGAPGVDRARNALVKANAGSVKVDAALAGTWRDYVEVLYRSEADRPAAETARAALASAFSDRPVKVSPWDGAPQPVIVAVGYHTPAEAIRALWLDVARLPNSCPDTFDYFPNGGLRIFYCHVRAWLPFKELRAWAGGRVFKSGPHTDELVLDSQTGFGHYDPEFVKWAEDALLPASRDSAFRKLSQPTYDQVMSGRARVYYATYQRMTAHPQWLEKEASLSTKPPYTYVTFMDDRWFDTPAEQRDDALSIEGGGFDCNEVRDAVRFWLRRTADGTAPLFNEGLKKLFALYEPRRR